MSDCYETIPVFDVEDVKLVGWEIGQADDGDMCLQVRCDCGKGQAYVLKLPPGAYIYHDPDEGCLIVEGGEFHGPMKPPAVREPSPGSE